MWSELSERERTRQVLQHVLGYYVLDTEATGYDTPDLGSAPPAGFHWPIAFWNTDAECWMTRDIATGPRSFDPLHDLNDAWLLVEHFRGRLDVHVGSAPFQYDVAILERRMGGGYFAASAASAPEAICLAALQAVGWPEKSNG